MSQQNVNTSAPESKESSSLKAKTQRRPAKAKADKVVLAKGLARDPDILRDIP